jgi:hypothetical protein
LEDLEKREMFLEDQRGAIIKGRQEGIEEGRQEGKGKLELVVRLLERRVGEIAPDIQSRIRRLSIEQLENLGEAVLDFTSASDLTDWLQGQKQCGAVFERESLLLWAFWCGWVWMVSGTLPGYCDVDLIAEASVGLPQAGQLMLARILESLLWQGFD